jgi:hypothetical protein
LSWHNTAWGLVCAQLHAYLLPEYPTLVLGIGPDDWARHDATQRIIFLGPGMVAQYQTIDIVVPDETIEPPIRGAAPPGKRSVADRVCPILCMIATPFNGNESTADTSAVVCEDLYERFLAARNTKAHGRASEIIGAKWFGSKAGKNGAAVQVTMMLRFTVYDKLLQHAKPTSTTVTTTNVANPAGVVIDTAVPGD